MSLLLETTAPRTTVCTTCRALKRHCDLETPTCGNCKSRGRTCVYPVSNSEAGSRQLTPAHASTDSDINRGNAMDSFQASLPTTKPGILMSIRQARRTETEDSQTENDSSVPMTSSQSRKRKTLVKHPAEDEDTITDRRKRRGSLQNEGMFITQLIENGSEHVQTLSRPKNASKVPFSPKVSRVAKGRRPKVDLAESTQANKTIACAEAILTLRASKISGPRVIHFDDTDLSNVPVDQLAQWKMLAHKVYTAINFIDTGEVVWDATGAKERELLRLVKEIRSIQKGAVTPKMEKGLEGLAQIAMQFHEFYELLRACLGSLGALQEEVARG